MKVHLLPLSFIVLLLASCAHHEEIRRAEAARPGDHPGLPLFEWHESPSAGSGPVSIAITLAEQKARVYRGGKEIAWTYVATGRSGFSSPRGQFAVQEKIADKRSGKYGAVVDSSGDIIDGDATAGRERIPAGGRFLGAPMPYWMRITSWGVGMHAGPIPNPGSPASHGCIRLPREMAERLFEIVTIGTPVSIR